MLPEGNHSLAFCRVSKGVRLDPKYDVKASFHLPPPFCLRPLRSCRLGQPLLRCSSEGIGDRPVGWRWVHATNEAEYGASELGLNGPWHGPMVYTTLAILRTVSR
jgi:hypothetical protein